MSPASSAPHVSLRIPRLLSLLLPFFSRFEEEASSGIPLCLCFSVFVFFSPFGLLWRWILNACTANFKTMTNFVVNSNMKGSLFVVATNKKPRFSSLKFFFLCQCVKCKFTQSTSHPFVFSSYWYDSRWRPNVITAHRKIQAVLSHMFIVFIVFSLRQADDPLTFKTVFSLNPSYLVDKYFCFVTLGESQRWIKEGDKDQEEKKEKKKRLPSIIKRGWFYEDWGWIQFYCQYAEDRERGKKKLN